MKCWSGEHSGTVKAHDAPRPPYRLIAALRCGGSNLHCFSFSLRNPRELFSLQASVDNVAVYVAQGVAQGVHLGCTVSIWVLRY